MAVHGLAILLGRNEAGISNRGKFFLHHAVSGADESSHTHNEKTFSILGNISGNQNEWSDNPCRQNLKHDSSVLECGEGEEEAKGPSSC